MGPKGLVGVGLALISFEGAICRSMLFPGVLNVQLYVYDCSSEPLKAVAEEP